MGTKQSTITSTKQEDNELIVFTQKGVDIIENLSNEFLNGNEVQINTCIKTLNDHIKLFQNPSNKNQKLIDSFNAIALHAYTIRQNYMKFIDNLQKKPRKISKDFSQFMIQQNLKNIKSVEHLFRLFQSKISTKELMNYKNILSKKLQKQEKNKVDEEIDNKCESLVTVLYLGQSVLKLINWKLSLSKDRQSQLAPQVQDWGNIIDQKTTQIVSYYFEWMMLIPSFSQIINIIDNKKSLEILKIHQNNQEWGLDIWINNSAGKFKTKLMQVITICQNSYKLINLFLSKDDSIQIPGPKKTEFYQLIQQIKQNFNWNKIHEPEQVIKMSKQTFKNPNQENHFIDNKQDQNIKNLNQQLKQYAQKINYLESQLGTKVQAIKNLQKQKKDLQMQNTNNLNRLNLMTTQKEAVQKRERQLLIKVKEIQQKQVSQNENQKDSNQLIIIKLQEQKNKEQNQKERLEKQLETQKNIEKKLRLKLKNIKEQFYDSVYQLNQDIQSLTQQAKGGVQQKRYPQDDKQFFDTVKKLHNDSKIKLQKAGIQFKNSVKQYEKKLKQLNQKNISLTKINDSLKQQNTKSSNQIQRKYKQSIKSLEDQLKTINQKNQLQIKNLTELTKKQNQYKLKVSGLQKNIIDLNNQLQKKLQEINTISQLKEKQQLIFNQKQRNLLEQIKEKNETLQQFKKHQNEIILINKDMESQIQILKNKKSTRCFSQYFNGHILNIDTVKDTQWIVNTIEKYTGREIRSTLFICKMDSQNKNNLHNYIDGIPNIVVIVRMENGQTVIAYSEPAFKKNMGNIDGRPGMILGLRNRRVLTVKLQKTSPQNRTEPRPITWDENYIIWGNTDLRIRMNDTEFYSNYSTANCSFEERGNKDPRIIDLFEHSDRTTKLLNYEFYEIKFEQ